MSAELSMDLKDTELTLRPPGSIYSKSSTAVHHHHHLFDGGFSLFETGSGSCSSSSMKRGFMETVDHADLKSSTSCCETRGMIKVNGKLEDSQSHKYSSSSSDSSTTAVTKALAAKARVIGWPPVRSTRQKTVAAESSCRSNGKMNNKYVKVGADGAPYLRKLDLEMYKSYHQLLRALDQMFTIPVTINGKCMEEDGNEVMKDGVKGLKMDECHHHHHHHHHVLTYEDKDGDWMLVGDVPWKMFIESCKRIRLMKSSEAVGIVPRTRRQTLPQCTK